MAELILALDQPDGVAALRLLDTLPGVRWVKVGPVLMTREGPDLLDRLTGRGLSVFLDLKWHDIPNTVAGAVRAARVGRVRMVTIHTLGGGEMMEAAAQAAGPELTVVGVTVLTSHSAASYGSAVGRGPDGLGLGAEAVRLARTAMEAGLGGIVASALEVASVRQAVGPAAAVVVPGIRRRGDPVGDQTRVATPGEAVAAGASHLVIGRAVTASGNPAAAWEAIAEEVAG